WQTCFLQEQMENAGFKMIGVFLTTRIIIEAGGNPMSYLRFLTDLPADIEKPMAHLLEAFQEEMRAQFVVSQEQWRSLQNLVIDLAESQRRTDEHMRALFEAQEVLTQSVRELTEA
ncbi:MAG: hypothetical protein RMN24_07275, partial [Anaerolineae bacterium]|nr:hypothetical protein [Anaerolineae bacterium]